MNIFKITRTFNAPRDLVWECWTKAEHIQNWLSPAGSSTELLHSDITPGGYNHAKITLPDGTFIYGKYTFKEINPKDSLIYVNAFSDEDANLIHHPMSPTWPLELLTTVDFVEQGDQTELTLRWEPIDAKAEETKTFIENLESCVQGWTGTFDKLDQYLESIK